MTSSFAPLGLCQYASAMQAHQLDNGAISSNKRYKNLGCFLCNYISSMLVEDKGDLSPKPRHLLIYRGDGISAYIYP